MLDDCGTARLDGSRSSGSLGVASPPENSIAVITFANITREPVDEWIGSGIAETVTADLKNVPGITVIGRERVFDALRNLDASHESPHDDRFAIEIGRGLGARWIVAGAFQRFGPQIRITARFVEVDTGAVLRNVKIDGSLDEIFALQDRIVFELTQDLQLTLEASTINQIRTPETRSVEAYELFSRGMMTLRLATRDAPDRAISTFERALAIDPDYAEAWAGLATAYQVKGVFLGLTELLDKAISCAERALALDPTLAEAHVALGSALFALGRHDQAATRARDGHRPRPEARTRPCDARARALDWARRHQERDSRARTRHRHQPAVRLRPPAAGEPVHRARRVHPRRGRRAPRGGPAGTVHLGRRRASWSSAPTRDWAMSSTGWGAMTTR